MTSQGTCWAAQRRSRVPLLFLARRQYLLALTDRRILVFARRRRGPEAPDLVIGKRYETFTLERVRRRRPLMQVVLRAVNGNRLVFEFRSRQRDLGGELAARLTPRAQPSLRERLGEPPPPDEPDARPTMPVAPQPAPDVTVAPVPEHRSFRLTRASGPKRESEPDDHTPWYKYKRREPKPQPKAKAKSEPTTELDSEEHEKHSFWGSD